MDSKQRSLKQNKYRWSVVNKMIMDFCNQVLEREGCEYRMSPEDADFFIKQKALKIAHIIPTSLGDIVFSGKLKTRSTGDFEEAMEQIRVYFKEEYELDIPLPNEDIRDIEEQYKDNLNRF